ncbi:MAG: hypothetical protein KJ941_13020 [Bacteroidetes bacterium]|nr:hypothetical protein [Bacteroidota bacterium]
MTELFFYKSNNQRIKAFIVHAISLIILIYFITIKYTLADKGLIILIGLICLIPLLSLINVIINRKTVQVNKNGITNNTNLMGLIEWKYIQNFEIKKIMGRELLVIHLTDINEVLQKKNFITRALMKSNLKKLGSPAVIGGMEFNVPLKEAIEKMDQLKNAYNRRY